MHPYPQYFPHRVDGDELDVVPLLSAGFASTSSRTLMRIDGRDFTSADLARDVASMQARIDAWGLRPGDRLAAMLGNTREHIALLYALIVSGVVWVPINTRLKAIGLRQLLERAHPSMLVVDHEFEAVAHDAVRELPQPPRVERIEALGDAAAGPPRTIARAPGDALCIIYTSGTTGPPKGVVFTHRMLRIAAESALMVADAGDGDRLLLWEPLCHVGGAQMLLTPFLAALELHVVDRFSVSRFWPQALAARATHLHYLGGILDLLMRAPADQVPPDHPVRVAWGAGVSAQAWAPIRARFGWRLRECYGMTECSSFATYNTEDAPGSIGRPFPWISIELVDAEGRIVDGAGTGELVLSSAVAGAFLPAYLDDPETTARVLAHGKLRTGDAARRDERGLYYFIGRMTDSVRVRGENVSAWEVERVIAGYPGVQDVAVVGVASDIGEQDILAYVQAQDADFDFSALAAWADERLASHQVPRYFRRVTGFERTPSERIRKHLLDRQTAGSWDRRAARIASSIAGKDAA
ncbi:MAG: AMP-binding protein [Lautropia sp.]